MLQQTKVAKKQGCSTPYRAHCRCSHMCVHIETQPTNGPSVLTLQLISSGEQSTWYITPVLVGTSFNSHNLNSVDLISTIL